MTSRMPATPQPRDPARKRPTQTERSQAMRRRLVDATLRCLVAEGYAAMTVSSIVRRAGVSRGAQVHHYPTKQALLTDTAEYLLHRTYRRLGALLLSIANEDNRLEALVEAIWEQVFATPLFRAYLELQTASHRDPVLARALNGLLRRMQQVFEPAVDHYFEAVGDAAHRPRALFYQLGCLLAGLASQAHLLGDGPALRSPLELWLGQASMSLRARKGVTEPPPRPLSV